MTTAGSRGSEIEISSQPSTCDERASRISQPCAAGPGVKSRLPVGTPQIATTAADASVASKSGPAGRRTSSLPARRVSRNPEYATAVRMPRSTPSGGFSP